MTADPRDIDEGRTLDVESLTRALRGRLHGPLHVSLLAGPEDDPIAGAFAEQLGRVAAALVAAAPAEVTFDHGSETDHPGTDAFAPRPALRLTLPDQRTVDYATMPAGPELDPFLELVAGELPPLPVADRGTLARLTPSRLQVFIGESCPHCPQAVRAAAALAGPTVSCAIIDAQWHGGLAQRRGVRSVPTTFLDDGFSFVGVRPGRELLALLAARGSRAHAAACLRSMLEGNRVDEATALVRDDSDGDALVACWRESTTSLRMGLLLAAEQALEQAPSCLDGVVADLLPLLAQKSDPALRGDTVDLLGRVAAPAAEPALRALANDPDPDVAEAASEGLAAIAERRDEEGQG